MKIKSKIPALRFKGFTDAWEERKLGEVIDIENGYAFKSEYFSDEEKRHIVLTPGSVKIGGGFQKDKGRYYDVSGVFPEKFIFKPGNIFITMTDLTPTAQSLGYPAIVPRDDNVYLHNQRLGKIINTTTNPEFLYTLLTTDTYHKEIVSSASGTTVKHSSVSKILDFKSAIPNIDEQKLIGSFFKELDNTIALHQRKCDQTKELKKTMLQKMFPKKGERIPEIRFPEFTDEWEEKKLGEVVEREIKGKAKANMQGTKSIYLETEYLNGGETTFVDSDADIEEDDILILWDGSQAGTVYHGFFGALGSTLKAYRPKESGKFVYYQLVAHQEMIFQRYRTPNIPHVIKTFTDEFSVFTTSLSEQERIGNFFKHLDTLIALHQSKCDSLKELKKTLLRQLFV